MAEVAKMPAITADKQPPAERLPKENFDDEQTQPIPKDVRQPTINSHHHDSEYDTASDLEGGDDDDYDDEDDDSLGADGEEDESENGSIGFDLERQRGDGQEQNEYAKKVDEDRSNPQYIPKKGNFYEHDDRTLDEPGTNEIKSEETVDGEQTKVSTPNISQTSKTMKKWQPASAVDRWSHDRFEETEQAPKSRQELVSSYGYDIRNEDGPPRPRRRRRYGRGPNKYNRNWEDESAYIKSTGGTPQRKPRPEDFPALGDRDKKVLKSRSFREEKENRYDRANERTSATFNRGTNFSQRDGRIDKRNSGKNFRAGRQSIEFKNQGKNRLINDSQFIPSGRPFDNDDGRHDDNKTQLESVSFTNTKLVPSQQQNEKITNHHEPMATVQMDLQPIGKMPTNNSNIVTGRPSPIAARLQVQNRNDPSHVGSIQMHSIMAQSPQENQQQASEANRTKRYSSLRQRSQNDVAPLPVQQVDQHSLQQQIQLHDLHQQPPQPQPMPTQQHVILQDQQHLLQANIMQLYHTQDNLQAQMQGVTLQGLTGGHQQKPQYQNVPQQYQTPAPNPTYYTPNSDYVQPTQPAVPAPYPQQPTATFIQPQSANPMASYSPQPQTNAAAPTALSYVQTPQGPPAAPAPYQNYAGYQNFNTVGGTTYFVPQQQTAPRPVVLPQRRPTNAIPILAPPTDKQKKNEKDDDINKNSATSTNNNAPIGSAENIDHILDNMFVQRPPYQPPTRKSTSPSIESIGTSTNLVAELSAALLAENSIDARLEEAVKSMTLTDVPSSDQPQQIQNPVSGATTTPLQEIPTAETG